MGHVISLTTPRKKVQIGLRQSDIAFDAIHKAIVRCELMPGSIVTEVDLANQFNVGRAGARAAVDRLSLIGLLYPVRRQGYRVKPITLRDLNDLFQLREIVEGACVRLAAGRVDSADLHRLDRLCRTEYKPGDKESEAAFLQCNSDFHLSIAVATGNERLVAVLKQTLIELERMFHFGLSLRDRGSEMRSEHQSLIEALANGDAETAERVTVDQVRSSRAMVLDAFLSSASLLDVKIGVSLEGRFSQCMQEAIDTCPRLVEEHLRAQESRNAKQWGLHAAGWQGGKLEILSFGERETMRIRESVGLPQRIAKTASDILLTRWLGDTFSRIAAQILFDALAPAYILRRADLKTLSNS